MLYFGISWGAGLRRGVVGEYVFVEDNMPKYVSFMIFQVIALVALVLQGVTDKDTFGVSGVGVCLRHTAGAKDS